jgi:hypothetical protein
MLGVVLLGACASGGDRLFLDGVCAAELMALSTPFIHCSRLRTV